MEYDNSGLRAVAVVVVVVLALCTALVVIKEYQDYTVELEQQKTERAWAKVELGKLDVEKEKARLDSKAELWMIWTAALAGYLAGPALTDILLLLAIAELSVIGGYLFGVKFRRGP